MLPAVIKSMLGIIAGIQKLYIIDKVFLLEIHILKHCHFCLPVLLVIKILKLSQTQIS